MLAPKPRTVGKRPHIQNLLMAEWNFQVVAFLLKLNLNVLLGKTTLWTGHILRPINARAQNSPVCSFISPQREIQLCMHAYHKMELLDLAQLLFHVGGYWWNKTCSCSSLLYRPEDMEACSWKNNHGLLTFLSSEGLLATLTILIKCMTPRSFFCIIWRQNLHKKKKKGINAVCLLIL